MMLQYRGRFIFSIKSRRRIMIWSALCLALVSCLGCRQFKKPSLAAPGKELSKNSYTVRFSGYKQTVTVKASPEELVAFLSDVNNWFMVSGAEVGIGGQSSQESSMVLGSSFQFSVRKMGIVISGKMIVIKTTPEDLWLVWDNPQMIHVQRWKFEPVKGGTRLTLRLDTESPESMMSTMMEKTGFAQEVVKEVDFMLAGIQAHFDPSLNPRDLVAMGLRGEFYDALWQIYEASVWADASLEQVSRFGASDQRLSGDVLMGFQVEGQCRDLPDVYYCPLSRELFGRPIKYDTFSVGDLEKWLSLNTYIVWLDYASVLESRAEEEAGGVRLRQILITEIPTGSGPNMMDLMVAMAGVPDELAKSVMAIKAGAESQGK